MSRAEAGSVTSSRAAIPSACSARTRSRVAEQSLTSAAMTRAPAAARLRANSCPSPRAAPVIATTLSRTSMIVFPSLRAFAPNQIRAAARGGSPENCDPSKAALNHGVGLRIDQMHVVEVGNERHRLAGLAGDGRVDPAAHLDAVDQEVDHRLHPHRLDDVEL